MPLTTAFQRLSAKLPNINTLKPRLRPWKRSTPNTNRIDSQTSCPIYWLPVELLEAIFRKTLADNFQKEFQTISLVCQDWWMIVSRLQLIHISVKGGSGLSRVISHIEGLQKVHGCLTDFRAPTETLSVQAEWDTALPPLDRLLQLFGSNLRVLHINGDYHGHSARSRQILWNGTQLPKIQELHFRKGHPMDLDALLCASRSTIRHLYLFTTDSFFLPDEGDWTTPLPALHQLRITNDATSFLTRQKLCKLAPNLKYLELAIDREELDQAISLLQMLPLSMHELMLWVKIGKYDSLTANDDDVRPLAELIKEKCWIHDIIVHMNCGSWSLKFTS